MSLLFGPLSRRIVWTFIAIVAVCFLLGGTAIRDATPFGGPESPVPGCPYRLGNHGTYACVSRALYEHVSADVQRFAAAVMAVFFTGHLGSALGGLKTQDAARANR